MSHDEGRQLPAEILLPAAGLLKVDLHQVPEPAAAGAAPVDVGQETGAVRDPATILGPAGSRAPALWVRCQTTQVPGMTLTYHVPLNVTPGRPQPFDLAGASSASGTR